MYKILVKTKNDTLVFSIQKRKTDNTNLNNTNVVNTQNIVFTDDYIIENLELVSAFLNVIILKQKITKVALKDIVLTKLVLNIINNLKEIKEFYILENENVTSDLADSIYNSNYLTYLECYNISNFMFEKLNKKLTVSVRCELLFISNFMKNNIINTYSDIYYKKSILINSYENDDFIDLETFLKNNKKLKNIDIKNYDGEKLKSVIKLLIKNDKKNIKINIYEENENINKSISYLKTIQNIIKKNKIKLNIIYSDEYKEKYLLKQINLNLLMTCLVIIIILAIGTFVIYKSFSLKQENEIEDIKDTVNEIIKNNETETKITLPTASIKEENDYTKEYSKVLSELKKINNETIGWLKVNNTNVDYPIVKHSDNDYYLNHSFSKKTNINGWLFADYRNSINSLDANTIIYGHNDGNIMFGSLKNILNKEWYTNPNNQIITFDTGTSSKWKIFSIYTTPVTSEYLLINFTNAESHTKFLNNLVSKSIYNFNNPVTHNDKILTLSTCYENSDNRLVVHAKKIS